MSVLVGTLAVDITNGQATFTVDDTLSKIDQVKNKAAEAGDSIDYSMREARESVMMTGEAFGVHLPAGITRAIASIGPLGAVLEAAFPLAAIGMGVALLVEHINKAKEAQEALTKGFDASGHTIQNRSDELQLSIEKDRATLNKLLGKPSTNGAAISLAEARVEADKLYDSLRKDNDDLVKLMDKASHGSVMTFLMPGQSAGAAQARDVAKGFGDALASIPHDSNYEANVQKATVDAWQRAQYEINKDKQDMQDNSGKDLTKDIQALQDLQTHLSQIHDEYQLIKQDQSLKSGIETARQEVSAAQQAARIQEIIAKSKAKLAEEQEKQLDQQNKVLDYRLSSQLKGEEKVAEAALKQLEAKEQINDLDAAAAHKQTMTGDNENIKNLELQYKTGLMSTATYISQKRALLQQEAKDENDYYAALVAAAKAKEQDAVDNKDFSAEVSAHRTLLDLQEKQNAAAAKYREELNQLNSKTGLQSLITQAKQLAEQFQGGLNKSIAQSIVEGKNFGKSMRQVLSSLTEGIIEYILQWVELKIVQAVFGQGASQQFAQQKAQAASLAGANAVASWSAAPWPVDAGAPAFGAEMMAAAMAFSTGGIVPGYGTGDSQPAMLTPGEGVLTAPQVETLRNVADNGSSGTTHYHAPNFQPRVSALDSEGVDRVLTKHASEFERKFKTQMRRRGK